MSLVPPNNRFWCDRCDTDFEKVVPFDYPEWSAFCPYCEKLIRKQPVCGSCRVPLGKKSKGIRCGSCGAVFTNTERYKIYIAALNNNSKQKVHDE